ncbi:acyltransferase domain-containing protein, partial [Streptomyces sp. URMC 123]|uniref:acyltransferase domain-containing protein n=1 Tax=Streptomyces sp. URMC 123 TaxID=3423403 RepID=UPI003F1C236B
LGGPAEVWDTGTAQPALFALQCALVRLWRDAGPAPAVTAGHSVGEFAALYAAGALALEDGLRATAERGLLMRRHCAPGGMVAVVADAATAEALAGEVPGLEWAVANGERAQVLAGPDGAVERLLGLLERRGIRGERLPVDRAFHTALVEPALDRLRAVLDTVAFRPLRTAFVSGVDGSVHPAGWTPDAAYVLRQTRSRVRFDGVLRGLGSLGLSALVELGPHTTLSGIARRALPDLPAVPTLRRGAGLAPLWEAAARLHCAGAELDWQTLLEGCGGRRIPLPGYRFRREKYWTGPEPSFDTPRKPPEPGAPWEPRGPREPRERAKRAKDEEQVTQDTTAVDRATAIERVLRHVVEAAGRYLGYGEGEIAGDTSFFDLGADSLQMINVLRELEQAYDVKIGMRELFEEATTPGALAELIVGRMAGPGPAERVPVTAASGVASASDPVPDPVPDPAPAPASDAAFVPAPAPAPTSAPDPAPAPAPAG